MPLGVCLVIGLLFTAGQAELFSRAPGALPKLYLRETDPLQQTALDTYVQKADPSYSWFDTVSLPVCLCWLAVGCFVDLLTMLCRGWASLVQVTKVTFSMSRARLG